jgi:hypothetical protein
MGHQTASSGHHQIAVHHRSRAARAARDAGPEPLDFPLWWHAPVYSDSGGWRGAARVPVIARFRAAVAPASAAAGGDGGRWMQFG